MKHLDVVKAIIGNSFLTPLNNQTLFEISEKKIKKTYPLLCIGSFSWKDHMISSYSMLVVFPIFFDYLDLHVDKLYNLSQQEFKIKIIHLKKNLPHDIEGLFFILLYSFCVTLRNKIVHHNFHYCDEKIIYGGKEIRIGDFKLINETIYQFVNFGFRDKSWYEINSMLSSLNYLLEKDGSKIGKKFKEALSKLNHFVPITKENYIRQGNLHNLTRKPTLDDKIFDYIHYNIPQSGKTVFGAQYYFIEIEKEYYLFPSELVIKNKEIRFSELEPWKYRLPNISPNQQVNTKIPIRISL